MMLSVNDFAFWSKRFFEEASDGGPAKKDSVGNIPAIYNWTVSLDSVKGYFRIQTMKSLDNMKTTQNPK